MDHLQLSLKEQALIWARGQRDLFETGTWTEVQKWGISIRVKFMSLRQRPDESIYDFSYRLSAEFMNSKEAMQTGSTYFIDLELHVSTTGDQ